VHTAVGVSVFVNGWPTPQKKNVPENGTGCVSVQLVASAGITHWALTGAPPSESKHWAMPLEPGSPVTVTVISDVHFGTCLQSWLVPPTPAGTDTEQDLIRTLGAPLAGAPAMDRQVLGRVDVAVPRGRSRRGR
jgi:hypothetical protein